MPSGAVAVGAVRRAPVVPDWRTALAELRLHSRVRWDESLKRLNTWRIGGAADCVVDVQSLDDLAQLLPFIREQRVSWAVIGTGSNRLVPDEGWRGLVLHLGKGFKGWAPLEAPRTVRVGAALADVTFAQRCIEPGWGGMEFLVGVPGTIGGAVAMNAGAHGGEIVDFLREVCWLDMGGNLRHAPAEAIEFHYRFSGLNACNGVLVTHATFELRESQPPEVRKQTASSHCAATLRGGVQIRSAPENHCKFPKREPLVQRLHTKHSPPGCEQQGRQPANNLRG